jgi:hypothetical protein
MGRSVVLSALLVVPAIGLADPALEWAVTYDGGGAYDDLPTAALADADGSLVLGGRSYDGLGGCDMVIRKYARATGDTLWHTRVAAPDGSDMTVTAMAADAFGDILVAGHVLGCAG